MKKFMILLTGILFAGILAIPADAFGQKVKKSSKDSTLQLKFQNTEYMLKNRDFVLEADYLANRMGDRVPVTSSLNFISVDSANSVLQIGSNTGMGYNGVGGVTAEGNITRYKLQTDQKRKSFYLSFSVTTAIGSYDINMSIGADGYANATLSGIRSGQLIYTGYLVPTGQSSVYKGYNTY